MVSSASRFDFRYTFWVRRKKQPESNVRSRSGSPTMPFWSVLGRKLEEDTMVKLLLTVIIFSAPLAAGAADGQSDGRYVAPEVRKSAPGRLRDEESMTST